MATQRHWYNDRELLLHGLVHSNYVTAITDWFMGFAGKWAELILYGTVLYSCAELYPGVHLPSNLSLAVFLVQLGALDIGGLSLAKLAKQAREDGNAAGANNAEVLSKWLIGIMLVGVVTVGLERALPIPIPDWVITSIDVLLVVARSICAVLYGRVVHDLKHETIRMMPVEISEQRIEQLMNQFNVRLQAVQSEVSQVVQEMIHTQIAEHVQAVHSRLAEQVQANQSTILEVVSVQLETRMQEMKRDLRTASVEASASPSDSSAGSSPRQTRQLRSLPAFVQSEPANEPVNVRVSRFIQERVNQGQRPSLSEIMNECQCSKNTAIRYRRELLGTDEEVVA